MRISIQEHAEIFEWWRLHRGRLNYIREQFQCCLKVQMFILWKANESNTHLGVVYNRNVSVKEPKKARGYKNFSCNEVNTLCLIEKVSGVKKKIPEVLGLKLRQKGDFRYEMWTEWRKRINVEFLEKAYLLLFYVLVYLSNNNIVSIV